MKTIVNFILDKSGSMDICREETISGFNEYLKTLQKKAKKGTYLLSLTLFDTNIEKPYVAKDILDVKPLNKDTYNPEGMTALYDASVETIEGISRKVDKMKEKTAVLNIIMTDGQENSSQKHDAACLNDLIKKLKKEGNWTFVFLGANQDSWATGNLLGVDAGNVANWNNANVSYAFSNLADNTVAYASTMSVNASTGGTMNTGDFFKGKKELKK
jgi:uncharacterized protein YegL